MDRRDGDASLRPRLRSAAPPPLVPGRATLTPRRPLASVAARPQTSNGRPSMQMLALLRRAVVLALAPIKIGLVQGFTGPFEVYAKQAKRGFELGLEYATAGKKELLGRKIEIFEEDDQLKPDVAKQKVTKLYADDKVDLIV